MQGDGARTSARTARKSCVDNWAWEFRYDGARARYMNRPLNPVTMTPYNTTGKPTVWSDYDGDEIYGDFTVSGSTVTNTDSYQPGLWRKVAGIADYLHSDMLGTLRQTTGTTGAASGSDVFTAFGERQAGSSDRFGYVGAWGYQSTPIPESLTPDPFPYLHVGARYYDPSSGRFLQRDPIGIDGGINVYAYVDAMPTALGDPDGLQVRPPGGIPTVQPPQKPGPLPPYTAPQSPPGTVQILGRPKLRDAFLGPLCSALGINYVVDRRPPRPPGGKDHWYCSDCDNWAPPDERHLHPSYSRPPPRRFRAG